MKADLKMPNEIFGIETGLLKLVVIPLVLVLVSMVVFFIVVVPKIETIGTTNIGIADIEQKTNKIKEKSSYLMSIDQNEIKRNTDYLTAAIMHESNAYYLVNVVRSIADKYGYQVDSFSVSPGKINPNQTEAKSDKLTAMVLPVSLTIVGSSDKYLDLMLAIERSLPILSVNKFDMKNKGDSSTEIDLQVSAYYVGDNVELNLANLSLADLTLSKEESGVVSKISGFEKIAGIDNLLNTDGSAKKFVKYDRTSPFNF
jgi:Tfp pilus assembly protein PilO